MKELQRSLKTADKELRSEARFKWKEVGEPVRADAASRFGSVDSYSAAGFKTKVRQRGVSVEQTRRNRGGPKRPNYSRMQQDTLDTSLDSKRDEVVDKLEKAIEEICDMVKGA